MSDSSASRPLRTVAIADPIWAAFEQMAAEMGTERDGLINQAMFMFARMNGFLNAGPGGAAPWVSSFRSVRSEAAFRRAITAESPAVPPGVRGKSENAAAAGGRALLLIFRGDPVCVTQQRFLIGRGKDCDLVINNTKVSREHAAVVREGGEFFIEDLDSSNGTWFNEQRVERRKIEDGDEFLICSEKVKFQLQ
jgi:hypothetical protein